MTEVSLDFELSFRGGLKTVAVFSAPHVNAGWIAGCPSRQGLREIPSFFPRRALAGATSRAALRDFIAETDDLCDSSTGDLRRLHAVLHRTMMLFQISPSGMSCFRKKSTHVMPLWSSEKRTRGRSRIWAAQAFGGVALLYGTPRTASVRQFCSGRSQGLQLVYSICALHHVQHPFQIFILRGF